jgi:hypothetical protein
MTMVAIYAHCNNCHARIWNRIGADNRDMDACFFPSAVRLRYDRGRIMLVD